MRSVFYGIGLAATLLLASQAHAQAMVEFCPATVDVLGEPATPAQDFTLKLDALGARSVSGSIAFQTDAGWFRAAVPAVPITAHQFILTSYLEKATRIDYYSQPLTVHFATPVKLQRVWMLDAQARGDGAFGWEERGRVPCDPDGGATPSGHHFELYHRTLVTPDVAPAIPLAAPIALEAPLGLDCAHPFADAKTVRVEQPILPYGVAFQDNNAVVELAIDARGRALDAWPYVPSPYKAVNEAAVKAALASTYAPGFAFCRPVPGLYLFTFEMSGQDR